MHGLAFDADRARRLAHQALPTAEAAVGPSSPSSFAAPIWAIALVAVLVAVATVLRLLQRRWKLDSNSPTALLVAALQICLSLLLTGFSVFVVMVLLWQGQTFIGTTDLPNVAAIFLFWLLLAFLVIAEGGQCAVVGLEKCNRSYFQESHGIADAGISLVRRQQNLVRFVLGRQVLVGLVLFLLAYGCRALPGAHVFNITGVLAKVFVTSNVGLLIAIVTIGQLVGQVTAASCMLDSANNFLLLVTMYVSFVVDHCGLFHCVHLVTRSFSRRKWGDEDHSFWSILARGFFWLRLTASAAVLAYSCAVSVDAILRGWTASRGWCPPGLCLVGCLALLCFLGLLEGLQIALFTVVKMKPVDFLEAPRAYAHMRIAQRPSDLQSVLIGRQALAAICLYLLARLGAMDPGAMSEHDASLGAGKRLQGLINTSALGALVVVTLGSLIWRLLAAVRPLEFLSNPLIGPIMYLCLGMEATGTLSAAKGLAFFRESSLGLQPDGRYVLLS